MRPEVARRAARLLADYDINEPPVPVEAIAASEGAVIARHHFDGQESGFALRADGRWIIGVNTMTSPRRRRFTIAHELGHLLLHPGRPLIVDQSVRVNRRDDLASMGTDREEIEANGFAAELLMPLPMVLAQLAQVFDLSETPSRDELTSQLAKVFDVSNEAMGFRLINFGILAA